MMAVFLNSKKTTASIVIRIKMDILHNRISYLRADKQQQKKFVPYTDAKFFERYSVPAFSFVGVFINIS